jgi:hypothetical protein
LAIPATQEDNYPSLPTTEGRHVTTPREEFFVHLDKLSKGEIVLSKGPLKPILAILIAHSLLEFIS